MLVGAAIGLCVSSQLIILMIVIAGICFSKPVITGAVIGLAICVFLTISEWFKP